MKYTYIYCLRFRSTHFYIGRARNLKRRFHKHKNSCLSKTPTNVFMANVWKKYGEPEIYILAKVPVHLEEQEEQKFIDLVFDKEGCLNLNPSSKGNRKIHTAETKAKISASKKGRPHTEESKAKISASQKGNKNCLGRTLTKETKAKISASLKETNRRIE